MKKVPKEIYISMNVGLIRRYLRLEHWKNSLLLSILNLGFHPLSLTCSKSIGKVESMPYKLGVVRLKREGKRKQMHQHHEFTLWHKSLVN